MTTTILNYSQNLLELIFTSLKKTVQGFMIGWMISRQTEANRTVVQQMINAGEYRQDEYWTLLHQINRKTIQSIHKEFGE